MSRNFIRRIRLKVSRMFNFDSHIRETIYIHRLEEESLRSKESLVSKSGSGNILVSLTTYNKRIYDVHLVIESLGRQTVKPDKICLWLDEEEFTIDSVPLVLLLQVKRGLDIRFCSNIRSYKKLIPSLSEFEGYNVITVDDDIIYPIDLVEKLAFESKKYPRTIIANLVHEISITESGKINKYVDWKHYTNSDEASMLIVPIGAGGVYYPSGCFYKDVDDKELFMKLSPSADDLWFKFMTMMNGYKSKRVSDLRNFEERFVHLSQSQDIALHHQNINEDLNDRQFESILEYYDYPYNVFNR